MSEATTTEKPAKAKPEVLKVKMTDGREVDFVGKKKVLKDTLIDGALIEQDGDVIQLKAGAIKLRMDFRNGETRLIPLNLALLANYAGHGAEQKFGDELAATAENPMSEDDMVVAIDDLAALHAQGKWGKGRAEGGGGVSGASTVIRALMEASGMTQDAVRAFLDKKLAATEGLTRRALYDSFRSPATKTGQIIKRMEDEKLAKTAKINADDALGEMMAQPAA